MHMRKIALVICEGETEENYIHLLKHWYKSPIKIVSHIEGTKITPSLVECRVRELRISARDNVKTFLMYDMDVPTINEKIRRCKAVLLLSNPCFELWILLHAKDQKSSINTEKVIMELEQSVPLWKNYTKSSFTETQKSFLRAKTQIAIDRAKNLRELKNPSTSVYKLVETLKETARLE